MMKQVLPILLIVSLTITGCFSLDAKDGASTQALASIAVRNISCEVAMSADAELIRTLTNIYESIKSGALSDDAMAQLSDLVVDRPTLAADISDIILLMGVSIDLDTGGVSGISEISPELWATIERAWGQGQAMCK